MHFSSPVSTSARTQHPGRLLLLSCQALLGHSRGKDVLSQVTAGDSTVIELSLPLTNAREPRRLSLLFSFFDNDGTLTVLTGNCFPTRSILYN